MNSQTVIRRALAVAFGTLLSATAAHAATIQYSTRDIVSGVSSVDYRASYNAQTSAVTTQNLAAFTSVAGGREQFSHLAISFTVGGAFSSANFGFQVAPDAGFGGALYLDGLLVDIDTSDIWWGLNWSSISELLTVSGRTSFVGSHTLDAYWAEGCCAGPQSARFTTNNGASYQDMTVANLERLAVPEPGTLAIVGLGLAALGAIRRRAA